MRIVLYLFFCISFMQAESINKLLFYGNCIACHGEVRKLSAPRMIEIKGYYLMQYPKKEDFVSHLSKWVYQPRADKSLLPQAVKHYKLMPYLSIDLDTLENIATYIYENDEFGIGALL